jgi:hypothetical protein
MSSPDQKISRKDQQFINTMLKLNGTMDKNIPKFIKEKEDKEKEDKEPGFISKCLHNNTLCHHCHHSH